MSKQTQTERQCIVAKCQNIAEKGGRICSKHRKQQYRGTDLIFKTGNSPKHSGRPLKKLSECMHPHRKIVRERKLLATRISLEDLIEDKTLTREEEISKTITSNVINLYHSLPHNSPLRTSLLNAVTVGLSTDEAANTFKASKETIFRATHLETNVFFEILSPINSATERIPDRIRREIIDWILTETTPKSGDKRTIKVKNPATGEHEIHARHPQRCTNIALYAQYVKEWTMKDKENEIVSFSLFQKLKPLEVRREVWYTADDKIEDCPHCLNLNIYLKEQLKLQQDISAFEQFTHLTPIQAIMKLAINRILIEANEKVAEGQKHLHIAITQRKMFKQHKANLREGELLIVQDFTKHYGKVIRCNNLLIIIIVSSGYWD